jgi:C4-dicarboxylate-specific signal transduction histidine kinase
VAHLARLNTMGQMATGLAHELNQPLTAIRNYTHYCKALLQTGKELTVKLPDALDKIDHAATRAAQIIQRLREFVRKQQPTRALADLNPIVRESLDLMAPVLQRGLTRIELHLAATLPLVNIDRVQIEQVLVNLIQNASDAMDQTPPADRVIVLGTRAGRAGDAVHITVTDRGCGIAPDQITLIFEEFHTTKPEGLGLGLAISKNIVERHGGRIEARPNPAGGMIFEVTLATQKGS